jgi:osmotically-inducible protein OsmY
MVTAADGSDLTALQEAAGVCAGGSVVEATVRSQLRAAPYAVLRQIACEFRDGVVLLHGRVPSFYMKQVAQNIVHCVEGVSEVRNHLDVVPVAAIAERP